MMGAIIGIGTVIASLVCWRRLIRRNIRAQESDDFDLVEKKLDTLVGERRK